MINDKACHEERLSKAERRLLDLVEDHDPSEIDLEAIAWDEGVEVRYEFLDGCEARLIGIANKAIVTIPEPLLMKDVNGFRLMS